MSSMATRRSTRLRHRSLNNAFAIPKMEDEDNKDNEVDKWVVNHLDVHRRPCDQRGENRGRPCHRVVVSRVFFVYFILFTKALCSPLQSSSTTATSSEERLVLTLIHVVVAPLLGFLADLGHSFVAVLFVLASSFLSTCSTQTWEYNGLAPYLATLSHTILVCQLSVCVGAASEEDRLTLLSRVGGVYGLGTIISPFFSFYLTTTLIPSSALLFQRVQGSLRLFHLPSVTDIICLLLATLPITQKRVEIMEVNQRTSHVQSKFKMAMYLLLLKAFLLCPVTLVQALLPGLARARFRLPEGLYSLLLQLISVSSCLLQGIVIPWLGMSWGLKNVFSAASFTLALTFFMLTLTSSAQELFLVLLPLCSAATVCLAVLSAIIATHAGNRHLGIALSMSLVIHHGLRMISEFWASSVLDFLDLYGIGFIGVVVNLMAVTLFAYSDDLLAPALFN